MSLAKLPLLPAAFLGLAFWLSGAGRPLLAQEPEAVTAVASPAARWGAVSPCRIVRPTFEPAPRHGMATPTRYPGGAKLSLPVAAPCPAKSQAADA